MHGKIMHCDNLGLVLGLGLAKQSAWVKVCDKSAAGFRRFCDLSTTENDVISEKET